MDKTAADIAIDILHERRLAVRNVFKQIYKGKAPLRQKKLTEQDELTILENMDLEGWHAMEAELGSGAVTQSKQRRAELRGKYGG